MADATVSAPSGTGITSKYVGTFGPVGSSVFTVRSTTNGKREVTIKVAGAASYTGAAGDTIPMAGLPITHVEQAYLVADSAATGVTGLANGYAATIDISTDTAPKLQLFYNGAGVSGSTDVSAQTFLVKLVGR